MYCEIARELDRTHGDIIDYQAAQESLESSLSPNSISDCSCTHIMYWISLSCGPQLQLCKRPFNGPFAQDSTR